MSVQDQRKAEEFKELLERVPASGSFESADPAEKIATLAKELFGQDIAGQAGTADQHVAPARE